MTRLANALWASAAIGLALTGTAVAQTSPTNTDPANDQTKNDNNDNKNDPKNKNDTATTSSDTTNDTTSTTTSTPSTTNSTNTTTNTGTTSTPSTGTTGTAGANGTTDVPGQAGTSGVAGGFSAEGSLNVPPPTPPPPPPPAVQSPQTYYTTTPAPTTTVIHEHGSGGYIGPDTGIGISIAAGGGAGGFVADQLRNTTNVGGDWDVRATVGTRSLLAFEGSYIGSAQPISALGLSNGATLVGNGVQGDVRLNGTLNLPVQPFLYAGAAWRRYDLSNTTQNLSDIRGSDDVLEIPMGVGLASHFGRAILDLRGEFRAATNEDLLPQTTGLSSSSANMNRWGAKATIGLEF